MNADLVQMRPLDAPEDDTSPTLRADEPAFNGAILTIRRIDQLIRDVTMYKVNGHILGYKENLDELFVEAQGFLSKEEVKKAAKDWQTIEKLPLVHDREEGVLSFEPELKVRLDAFNQWLRLKLHRHHVTMVPQKAWEDGFERIKRKYKLY